MTITQNTGNRNDKLETEAKETESETYTGKAKQNSGYSHQKPEAMTQKAIVEREQEMMN